MTLSPAEFEVAVERFYDGQSPGDAPLYGFADAARMIGVPASTARWWMRGRRADGHEPVLLTEPSKRSRGLSFLDLLELYAVKQLRKVHGIRLDAVRRAVRYAETELGVARVLLREDLATFGDDVFLTHLGDLVALSSAGQLVLLDVVKGYLRRVDREDAYGPVRFYPEFPGMEHDPDGKPVSISPFVAFGRPTVTGTGIRTSVVAARIDAGESVSEVARDYSIGEHLVTSAIRYEYAA